MFILEGCAWLKAEIEGVKYPTAVIVNGVAYQINLVQCAQIKEIGPKGELVCYDMEGNQSASASPVSDWRRRYIEEDMGVEWASPEHQAFLFYMFHQGGIEEAAKAIVGSLQQGYTSYKSINNLVDSIDKSLEIQAKEASLTLSGMRAYMSGGMPAWQEHQYNVIVWRLNNVSYFLRKTRVGDF